MDDELRQAFATLSAQMSDIGSDARKAAEMSRETAHEMVKLARKVDGLETDVGQLKVAVFGSTPPPAPQPPVMKRITHSEGEIAELAGQVIAVKGEVAEVKGEVAAVKKINEAQSQKLDEHGRMLMANTADTVAIRREIVDGVRGFVHRNPQLVTGFVTLVSAAMAFATAWFSKGH